MRHEGSLSSFHHIPLRGRCVHHTCLHRAFLIPPGWRAESWGVVAPQEALFRNTELDQSGVGAGSPAPEADGVLSLRCSVTQVEGLRGGGLVQEAQGFAVIQLR